MRENDAREALAEALERLREVRQERDALKARLAWAESELGKVWAALRDAR
jgi:hypothetical protein